MKIRHTKRPQLARLEAGSPQVTFRGTAFGTIMLQDEFRTVEFFGPGRFFGEWTGTCIECDTPSWIRKAAVKAYLSLAA